MKILALFVFVMLSLSFLAAIDLAVTGVTIAEPGEPGATMDLTISFQNIGEDLVKTRLPAQISFDNEQSTGAYPLVSLYVDTRLDKAVRALKITSADGIETEQFPVKEKVSYLHQALSDEALKIKLQELEIRLEVSPEEKILALKEAKEFYSKEHELEVDGWFITLQPGDTVKLDSSAVFYNYPFEEVSSLESKNHHFNVLLDPYNEMGDEKTFNNFEGKVFSVSPTILQGPTLSTSKYPALEENEYFVTRLGCADLQGKKVCSELNEDKTWTISVNEEKQTYDLYGLLMKWFNGLFSDSKLADAQTIAGTEVTVYVNGYKVKV